MNERTLEERIIGFTTHLRRLAKEGGEDRAALAALRSGLGAKPGAAAAQHPHVMPFLGEKENLKSDKWFFVVGALFAWHPATAKGKHSLGASFRELKDKDGASESIEKRFVALLASDERDLHLHLRQIIGLLRANEVPVNWRTLLEDLAFYGWNQSERRVQLRWARDYYRTAKAAPETQTTE